MSYPIHEGREGYYSRCRASIRMGGGVKGCPGVEGSVGGHQTISSLAGSGGGKFYRSEGLYNVSAVDKGTGLYSMSVVDGDRVRYFDAETDKLVGWKDKRSDSQRKILVNRAAVSGPSFDLVEVNSDTPESLRKWFGEFERGHGVEINKYNHDGVVEVFALAHEAAVEYLPRDSGAVKFKSDYANFMKKAVLNLVVFEKSPDVAVDSILREKFLGKYKKVYKSGR